MAFFSVASGDSQPANTARRMTCACLCHSRCKVLYSLPVPASDPVSSVSDRCSPTSLIIGNYGIINSHRFQLYFIHKGISC